MIVQESDESALPVFGTVRGTVRLVPPPGENIYVASTIAEAKSASKNLLSLFNGIASPFRVLLLSATISQEDTAAVTGLVRGYRLFRFTTLHSGGTLVTVRGLDTAAPPLHATITARRTGPTIGGVEAEALGFASLHEEETGGGTRQHLFDFRETDNFPVVLNPGQGLVIQQDGTAGTGLVSAAMYFRQF